MFVNSKNLASWLAIVSLIFSSVLTIAHNHGDSCDCGDDVVAHSHVQVSEIAGLESLPPGDCDCTGCEIPAQQDSPEHEHDEDTCSICRMVYEHGEQGLEFEFVESQEEVCDSVVLILPAIVAGPVSEYLTRGPPTFPIA